MTGPLVSVLLPTRGRPDVLRESVASLIETAGDPTAFEIRFGIDEDDPDTERALGAGIKRDLDWTEVFSQRHGYAGLHRYINSLAKHARGQWLMLWNDDAVMQTYGWDWRIRELPDRYILDCWTNHLPLTCTFPIVPRHWVQTLGHFSLNAHCDTWWQLIGEWTHRLVRADIDVQHNRFDLTGRNNDPTYREGREQYQTHSFYSADTVELIKQDANVVMGLLTEQRNRRLQGRSDWE